MQACANAGHSIDLLVILNLIYYLIPGHRPRLSAFDRPSPTSTHHQPFGGGSKLPPHSPHGLRAVVRLLLVPLGLFCCAYFARTLAVAKTLKAAACACASGCILDGGHVRCVDCLFASAYLRVR